MSRSGSRDKRLSVALPFLVVAAIAIIGAGLVAAASAHAPSQPVVWMVAYLVLVVGTAQAALGVAQAWCSLVPPSTGFRMTQFLLFNAGNVGVIGGTLYAYWPVVLAGSVLFTMALTMFLYSSWKSRRGWPIHVYRLLLASLFVGAAVGTALSAIRHLQ